MLQIKNLRASVNDVEILKGLNLTVRPGEVHALMGPNGSGKSTTASILAGNPAYKITGGEVIFEEKDLLSLSPDKRAGEGIFMAFQYPVEIPGVSNINFLKTAIQEIREYRGLPPLDAKTFMNQLKEKQELVQFSKELSNRSLNEGFSGGEKKRNEIFQLAMLEPKLSILDETDSGLDIDALRIVANGVNTLRSEHNAFIIITHYQRLLDYIEPDYVHILYNGKIIRSGGRELSKELEIKGYDWIRELSVI